MDGYIDKMTLRDKRKDFVSQQDAGQYRELVLVLVIRD